MTQQAPTLQELLTVKKWMEFMSQPGPKAEINGVPQAYPAEGRESARTNLAQVNELIARLYPDHAETE